MAKKTKAKKTAGKKPRPRTKRELEIARIDGDVSYIADYIANRESVTVETLMERGLTKKELLDDLNHIWNFAGEVDNRGCQFKDKYPQSSCANTIGEIRDVLSIIKYHVHSASGAIERLDGTKNTELMCKHTVRAYKRAGEDWRKLLKLTIPLGKDADEKLIGAKQPASRNGTETNEEGAAGLIPWELQKLYKYEPVSMTEFMRRFCRKLKHKETIRSYCVKLYRASTRKKDPIKRPDPVKSWSQGSKKLYAVSDLYGYWRKHTKELSLPELKAIENLPKPEIVDMS